MTLIKICAFKILILISMIYTPYRNVYGSISINEFSLFSVQYNDSEADTEDFDEMDRLIEEKNDVTFTEVYNAISKGDMKAIIELIGQMLYNSMLYELSESRKIFVQLIAVIMFGTLFTNLAGRISGYAGGNGFFVTYLILASLLLSCFTLASEIAIEIVSGVTELMLVFIPAYQVAAAYSNGQETAMFSREIIMLVIFICENVLLKIVFPIVKCSGICGLVNRMNAEDYFSKLTELLKSIAGWIMKSLFAAITGLNLIKGIISPSIDRLGRNSAIKLLSSITGPTASVVAGIIVSSGMFIKNCIGIAGAVIVVIITVVPAVKIFLLFLGLKAIAALVQPLGDKRFSEGVSSMAESIELLFKLSGMSILMFIISITAITMLSR